MRNSEDSKYNGIIYAAKVKTHKPFLRLFLTHSLIHHFETVPNSKKLQMTT